MALTHELANGSKDVIFVDAKLAGLLQTVGEDVEEELRVGAGINMSVTVVIEEVGEVRGVD